MNPNLDKLQPYPFQKLAELKAGTHPPHELTPIAMSIGEPKHPTPDFIRDVLIDNMDQLSSYPTTQGLLAFRETLVEWLVQRFNLPVDSLHPDQHVLPVNGTREALFAIAQVIIDTNKDALVLMPNPFYQIYEGAAYLSGATPHYLPCTEDSGFLPDFDQVTEAVWSRCQLLFLCSPANPTGAVLSLETLQKLINLAEKYDFVMVADECYSEIYQDEHNPPIGLLDAAAQMGNEQYTRCLVFHSLSKRSNAPGLRSGFVAGDATLIAKFLQYRTYHGSAMSGHHQLASMAAWKDEQHVMANREAYREKFQAVSQILGNTLKHRIPPASFYLWPETPIADTDFARGLYDQQHLTVLPGSFLSRSVDGFNPGDHRIRLALVAPLHECIDAAQRIKHFTESL